MRSVSNATEHRDFGPGAGVPIKPSGTWRDKVVRVARGPWGRPLGRGAMALGALVFLSWLGARSASSAAEASSEPEPQLASLGSDASASSTPVSAVESGRDSGTDADGEGVPRGVLADGRVVLNVANESELCQLPSIGPSRAQKIIELRQRLGRFNSLRQLLRVRGIGPRTLEKLRPRLVLDAPDAGS